MKVFLATPAYHGVQPETVESVAALVAALEREGMLIDAAKPWSCEARDSNQPRARNVLFHKFLLSGADRMIGHDADQLFTPAAVLSLLAHDVDVIVPMIRRKDMTNSLVGEPHVPFMQQGALIAMRRIGFGMFVVKREAIAKLAARCRRDGQAFSDVGGDETRQDVPAIVDQRVQDGRWQAVDDVFSSACRASGIAMYTHTETFVGHIGAHVF